MSKTLRNIIASAFLGTSFFFSSMSFADKKVVFDQIYSVPMTYDDGTSRLEKLNVHAEVDEDTNTLYIGTYTENYNKQDWKGDKALVPVTEQYTNINYSFSDFLIFGPPRVKIKEQAQRAYLVPKHEWSSELQPYETSQISQFIVEIWDLLVSKVFSKISFLFNRGYDKYVEDAEEQKTAHYDEVLEQIDPDYKKTEISPHIPKSIIGFTETAREYTIQFNIGNTQDEIPMFVWLNIYLGNPAISSSGSFPNRHGKLEEVLIKFTLNESYVKRDELYDYFLHGDELKAINVSPKNVEGTSSNPAIITINNLNYNERRPYQEDKVVRIGMAEYILQERGDSVEKDLSWGIVLFESDEARINFMKKREENLKYPLFVKGKIMSYIEYPTIDKFTSASSDFNEEQAGIYADLILAYSKRTGMPVILDKDSVRSKRLLKEIENFK